MSEFRRNEIKRTLDQMRDGLTFIRKIAHEPAANISPEEAALQGTAFAAAFIDLLGGMAVSLSEINEKLDKATGPQIAEAFGLEDPDAPVNDT